MTRMRSLTQQGYGGWAHGANDSPGVVLRSFIRWGTTNDAGILTV